MTARDCQKRITALKEWRMNKGYTVEQCIELCNGFPSDTTVRRIFNTNSGEKTFRESTIAALELALMGKLYNPDISIPVEDVIEAQKETAELAEKQSRIQTLKLEQLKAKLRVCYVMLALFFTFNSVILFYDLTHPTLGFFNSPSTKVWYVQFGFLIAVAVTLAVFFVRYWLRKKEIKSINF